MKFKFITLSDPYYRDELMLRWEVIEKPKGLPPGLETLSEEEIKEVISKEILTTALEVKVA